MGRRRGVVAGVLAVVAALALAACGGSEPLRGTVRIVGSTTAQPVVSRLAGAVIAREPRVEVEISGTGTSAGLLALCDGRAEMAMASRAVAPREEAACAANGLRLVGVPFALDAVVVATGPDGPADCLSSADLYALTGPESTDLDRWNAAQALAVEVGGGEPPLSPAPLQVVAPDPQAGTTGVYLDLVIAPFAGERGRSVALRDDARVVRSDRLVADQLRRNPAWLGILGFTAAQQAGTRIQPVAVNGGGGCVAATPDTVADRSYPLTRQLYLAVAVGPDGVSPAVAALIDEALAGRAAAPITEAGAVPLSDDERRRASRDWAGAR